MPTYSDAEMRAIMGRALQIDSGRSDRFTPEQLRTIAGELGISTQALEVALYEVDSKGRVSSAEGQSRPATRGWAKGLAIAAGGVLLVLASAFLVLRLKTTPVIDRVASPGRGEAVGATPVEPAPARATPVSPGAEPTPVKRATKKTSTPPIKKTSPPPQL